MGSAMIGKGIDLRSIWVPLTTLLLAVTVSLSGWAQPTPTPQATNTPAAKSTPASTNSIPALFQLPFQGNRDESRAMVRGPLSGKILMSLASAEGFTARARADRVVGRLRSVAESQGTSAALVTQKIYDGVIVLSAADQVLATVMPEDAGVIDPRAMPTEELRNWQLGVADAWRANLQKELAYSAWLQRPEYLKFALPMIALVFFLALGLHRSRNKVRERFPWVPVWSLGLLMWTFVTIFVLWMFPLTKRLAWLIESTFLWPFLKFYLLGLVISIISYLVERLIRSYFDALIATPGMRPRRAQRLETLSSVLCNSVKVVGLCIVVALALSFLPFNLGPLLTSAGVVGIAIGLAGQDFLKDIIAGIFILLEDRFGVGDWIEWGTYAGTVEAITLRATRLRTIEGGLVTVPNSELRVVNNLSNEWAQVDYRVSIAYSADVDLALKVLEEEALKLAEDWNETILEPPTMKGVQALGESAVELRLYFRTLPLLQWDVQREFNHRMKHRLDREGIEIPFRQTAVWLRNEEPKAEGTSDPLPPAKEPQEQDGDQSHNAE